MTRSARRSRPYVNLLLVAVSVLLALLALEVGFRLRANLGDRRLLAGGALARGVEIPAQGPVELGHMIRLSPNPAMVYELKPDLEVSYQGAVVITDGRGLRVSDEARPTAPGATCIVGIGDSFMFGLGVPGSATYLAVLEDRLGERRPGRAVRVVNTAAPGYNTVMEVAALEEKGLSCAPAVVIVEFVGNDLSLPNFVREPRRPWSLRRSFLDDFVRERLGLRRDHSLFRSLLDNGLRGIPQDAGDELGNAVDPALVRPAYRWLVGWDAYERATRRLLQLSESHGFQVVSISLGPEDTPLKRRALELARSLGFQVLDIGAGFRAYLEANGYTDPLASPLALRPNDGHPSALAHRMAGEILALHLDTEVLPPD